MATDNMMRRNSLPRPAAPHPPGTVPLVARECEWLPSMGSGKSDFSFLTVKSFTAAREPGCCIDAGALERHDQRSFGR